jgi:serine/threonine protein kinase
MRSSADLLRKSRFGEAYLAAGHTVAGKYIVESVIGEGATSVVYAARRNLPQKSAITSPAASEAVDEDTDPPEEPSLVALKVIHRNLGTDPQIAGRFQREAAILKRLQGPHVLRVYEALEEDGLLVLVLEHVASTPLDQRLAEARRLDVATAVEITLQVCAGLGTAHAAGVVHRDLKPANVLSSADVTSDRVFVKVADFGLAKVVHGEKMITGLTEQDMIFGTPEYMAPEQARGEDVDARADIYATGCMLYEMLTGEVPFHEPSPIVTMTAHMTEPVIPPRLRSPEAGISSALEAVVLRALAKDPAHRYPSARAFAEALLAAKGGSQIVAATAGAADALGDTDLNLSGVLTHSPTLPMPLGGDLEAPDSQSIVVVEEEASVEATQATQATQATTDTHTITRVPPAPRSGTAWLWIVIAVLAAAVGIGIGIAVGAR